MNRLFIFSVLWISLAHMSAQTGIPQKSPKAYVDYKVGLTEVAVQYSSPAVRGRTIWGGDHLCRLRGRCGFDREAGLE